jgi:zinc finger protein
MVEELTGQQCPICSKPALTLREEEVNVPHFGKTFIFSMICSDCGYKKADVESAEKKAPCKYTFEVSEDADLNIRFIKSGQATVKIPHMITMEPGTTSEGFVSNIEGVLKRIKSTLESTLNAEDDAGNKKKLKNMIKKLNKVLVGREKLKIIVSDPSGNSAIISDKAVKGKP